MSVFFGIAGCSFVSPSLHADWNQCIPASMKRRDPRIWHMAYAAAFNVITNSQIKPNSIITGTALGALDETKNFLDTVFDTGFGSPRYFISSVHNSMAGKIALELKIPGPNITVCEGQNSLASSITMLKSFNSADFPVLVILVDEHIELLDRLSPMFSDLCKSYLKSDWADGAVGLLLTNNTTVCDVNIRSIPPSICKSTPEQSINEQLRIHGISSEDQLLLKDSSSSYLQPGISVHNFICEGTKKRALIGSYAPSSNSVAVVEIVRR